MSWGSDVAKSFDVGYESGQGIKAKRKQNKIAEILSQAYQAPQAEVPFQTDEEQLFGMQGLQGNVAQEAKPGGFDSGNAIARMYQQGYGPEAMQLEQQLADRELGGLLKRSQIAKALRPNLGEAKPGVMNGKEVFFRTDDAGNTYDLSGNRITGMIQPRPQQALVNLGNTMEKEESKGYGKYLIDSVLKPAEERAFAATKARQAVDAMRRLKVKTGKLAPAATEAASWVSALGGDPKQFGLDNPATAQSFTAIGQQVVLDRQMAQKGPQTENDARRLEQTFAKLGNTPEANEFILDVTEAQAKRDQEYRNFLLSYRRRGGSLDGAQESWESGPGRTSIFDDQSMKKWVQAAQTQSPAVPQPQSQQTRVINGVTYIKQNGQWFE
jgi:hypothetical protein